MGWIKDKLFNYRLKKRIESVGSTPTSGSTNKMQQIGILFDENQIDSLAELQKYVQAWIKKGKKVETFSFVDIKEFPPEEIPLNKFCKKNLNWYNIPHGETVQSFLDNPYDILITINPEKKDYLHFLNAGSKAKFKIGLLPDELELYNLIVDCEQPAKVKYIFSDIQSTLDKLAT